MTFDQAKALRLQQWRSTLDDHDFRMQNPEAHRQTLHSMSITLAAEGLIDALQHFDMDEMADAAYWHAVEELQTSQACYYGASSYDVFRRGSAKLLGKIARSIFHFEPTTGSPRSSYDGKIYRDATGANLVFNPSGTVARITELTLILPDGQPCDLVETGRTIEGVRYEPIDDPDIYRGLIDIAQVARECRNLHTFEKMRPRIDLARFLICPDCLDHFNQRDDCPRCFGQGFVTKTLSTGLP